MRTTAGGRGYSGLAVIMTLAVWMLAAGANASEAPAMDEAPFFAGNDELRSYLLEAGEKHPGLKALHEEWRAALEHIPQARAFADPMLTYKQFMQSDMKEFVLMFEQAFPWFGTLRLRGERAAVEAEAVRWKMYAERNRIFAAVKKAYFEYAYRAGQIRVIEAQIEIIDYTEEIVNAKYGLGLATQDDLLRIQSEADSVADLRAQLLQLHPALAARLNEAIGRPLGQAVAWPQPALFPPDPPAPALVTARIRLQNPEVNAADAVIAGRETEIDLARRLGRPEMRLGFEYERLKDKESMRTDPLMPSKLMAYNGLFRSATGMMSFDAVNTGLDVYGGFLYEAPGEEKQDSVSVSLTMSLPIWRKKVRGAVAEARHRTGAARYDKQALARALDAEARMALFAIQDGQRRMELYEERLIPRAKQTYESLQRAYASGAVDADFLDMLGSIRELLDFHLEELRAARDWLIAAADLERLLGGTWTGQPEVTQQTEGAASQEGGANVPQATPQ